MMPSFQSQKVPITSGNPVAHVLEHVIMYLHMDSASTCVHPYYLWKLTPPLYMVIIDDDGKGEMFSNYAYYAIGDTKVHPAGRCHQQHFLKTIRAASRLRCPQ